MVNSSRFLICAYDGSYLKADCQIDITSFTHDVKEAACFVSPSEAKIDMDAAIASLPEGAQLHITFGDGIRAWPLVDQT